jgi:hypothetical protein
MPVQVIEPFGAKLATGIAGEQVSATFGSLTVTPVKVVLPVFVATTV